ncbi:dipeptidase [Acidilobus saccharovorans]|uniref:dipeptidase n=1 Tax=Acidilobus saccharovorans TaxID=242703 RepID=UPI0009FB9553|nr:membrane dipeptidase [Acidilobus saccharovorans]
MDLHEDIGYWYSRGYDFVSGQGPASLDKLSKLGDVAVVAMIFPAVGRGRYDLTLNVLLNQLKYFLSLELEGKVRIVRRASDLDQPGVKLIIGLEGTDALSDAYDLLWLFNAGLRVIAPTWNYNTKFASSCTSKKDYGLTDQGEELVKLANELGVIIDVSHSSRQTTLDVTSLSRKPVIATHSNVMALKQHYRNLDDAEIEGIVKTGGVIGVTSIPGTLPSDDINGIATVASYIGERFGWDYVALGTDFLGLDKYPQGFSDLSNIDDLASRLGSHAEAVLWGNALRVFRQALPQ